MQEFSPEWFDESSKAWRANKKRVGESWKYVCSNDLCKRVCPQILGEHEHLCARHSNTSLSEKSASLPTLGPLLQLPRQEQKQELQKRRSPRLLPPLASKPASSQGTSPTTRSSQRLRRAESQAVLPGPVVAHRAVRKLRASPSQ